MGFVRGIERIREGEPGAEGLVIGRFDAYVVGFECYEYEKLRSVESWSKMLVIVVLTREVMFLRQIVPRKERYFDVVHVNEPVAERRKEMVTRPDEEC